MRITIDIDPTTLLNVQRLTGEAKKAPAVQKAVESFLRDAQKRELLTRVRNGEVDFPYTNDEIEAMWEDDID